MKITVKEYFRASLLFFVLFFSSSVFAATVTWTGVAGDGLWSSATNWDSNALPTSSDNVVIPKTFTVTVSNDAGKINKITINGKLIISVAGILNVEQTVTSDPLVDIAGGEIQNNGSLTIKQTIASNTNYALKFTNGTDAGDAKLTNAGTLLVDLSARPAASSVACISFAQTTTGRTAQFKFGGTMTFTVPAQARLFEITSGNALMDGTYTFGSASDYKNWRFIQLTQGSLTLASTANITFYSGYNLAYAGTIASSNSKDITFTNNGNLTIHGGTAAAGYGIYMNPQNATNICTFINAGTLVIDENFPLGCVYMSGGGSTGLVTTYSTFNNQAGAYLSLSNSGTGAGALVANAIPALTVTFNNAGTVSLNSGTTKNMYFGGSNSTFNNTGTVNLTKAITGNSTANGCVVNNTGGTFNFNVTDGGQPAISNANKITFNNNGGTVAGQGVFSAGTFVPMTGTLSPGGTSGVGVFTFADATLALTGKCILNINGKGAAGTDYDQITSTGTLDISGLTMEAKIGTGYTPINSDNAPLVSAASVTGQFSSVSAPANWSMFYNATNAILSYGDLVAVKKCGIKIMMKLDDLQALNNTCPSTPTMDYLIQKQVKAGIGAIAKNFDNTALAVMSPYLNATNSDGDKLFEVWHHGLDHIDPEFKGTTYAYQKAHFDQATQLIKTLLGVQMHSFGTPFNASDATTNTVISEDPNYKAFMFPSVAAPASTGILNLNKRVDMENGVGNPDYAFFLTNFNNYKTIYTDYMVFQGHPNQWNSAKLDQFKMIVEYLIAQGCEFVLPYDYYRSLTLYPPTGLVANVVSSSRINLTWTDNATSEYNYKIERSSDSINWETIATLPENSVSYTDTSIPTTASAYYYRVYANCGIKSGYSNVVATPNLSTKTLFPTDDVYLYKGSGTTVTGNEIRGMETTLNCYRNPASQEYWWSIPYFKFNLQNITSVPDRVKLRVFGTVKEAHGFDIYTTSLTGWAEDALTFNNVAAQAGVVSANPVASLDVHGSTMPQYYEWDVTSAVKAAIDRGESYLSLKMQDRYAVKDAAGSGIIVQFHSKENLSGNKPMFIMTDKNIDPFKLSELKLNGSLINGFMPTQVRYNVTLPYNTTVIPSITALAVNPLCTLKVTDALNLTGTETDRTTRIVAKIGQDSVSYKVVFSLSADPGDARLDSLMLNKVNLENFNKDNNAYHVYLPYTSTEIPVIQAKPSDSFASVSIVQPANLSGTSQERTARINVISQNGLNTKSYAVEFEVLPKLDVFLALGQSNMSGRGTMVPSDLDPISDIYILTSGANLEIASNPLNKYSSVRKELSLQQMSPSCSFVKTIRDRTQHKIGLMQNARGGSAIESWLKGSPDRLYEEALRRAIEIKRFGEIKGIIWHQGESNSGDPTGYKAKLSQMVSDFRTDLGISNLYFVAGEIAQWSGGVAAFNSMIRTIASFIPYTDWASSDGLTPLIDASDPHFDAASVKTLGERYAAKMLSGVYNLSALPTTNGLLPDMAHVTAANGSIRIDKVTANMTLHVLNVAGKSIVTSRLAPSGNYSFVLPGGVYFVQLTGLNCSDVVKIIL